MFVLVIPFVAFYAFQKFPVFQKYKQQDKYESKTMVKPENLSKIVKEWDEKKNVGCVGCEDEWNVKINIIERN